MTILCITGFSTASTQMAERALLACGMAPHLPLERDPTLDLVRWHERVSSAPQLTGQSTHSESADRIKQPSRIWQQLAIDLVVANMDSANWGWAHPSAVQWLEFWAQLDSEIRFVLVCEDRQSLVCRLVEQGEAPVNIHAHLALWAQTHQEMLRFHLRNPDKSLLVWDAEVQSQPSTLIQRIERDWQIPLNAALADAQSLGHPTALLQHIALRILGGHPQAAPIDHELQSLIGPSHWPSAPDQIETTDLIEIYGHLIERTELQGQLQLALQNIDDINELRTQDLEKVKAETAVKQDAMTKLAAQQTINAALKKETDELSIAQQQALAKNKDLQEESDLLLTQLHQVQEELEKYFLMNQDAQEKVKVETAAKQDALNKLAAEQKVSADLKKQTDGHLAAKHKALTRNNDLQAQLTAITQAQVGLQSELEEATKRHAQLEAERDALVKAKEVEITAKNQALAERDALAQAKAQLQSQLEALEKAIAESQAQLHINSQVQSDLKGHLTAITQAQVGLQSELEEATKRHAQLEAERDALVKAKEVEIAAKEKAVAERDALAKAKEAENAVTTKAKTERDALAKEKQILEAKHLESQKRLQQLESANQDLQNRQHLQHEELVKAEAQIELIKDLLLREQGI